MCPVLRGYYAQKRLFRNRDSPKRFGIILGIKMCENFKEKINSVQIWKTGGTVWAVCTGHVLAIYVPSHTCVT